MSVTEPPEEDDIRLTLAEIGGALSEDEIQHAEQQTLELLGQIRRLKQEGDEQ